MKTQNPWPRGAWLPVLLAACLAAPAAAEVRRGENEYGAWAAGAPVATTFFGGLKDDEAGGRASLIVALSYARTTGGTGPWAFRYVLDVLPVEMAFGTIVASPYPPADSRSRADVYGFGINPLGLGVIARDGRVRPFATASGGLVEFQRPVPLPQETRFVFSGDVDAGVQLRDHSGHGLTLGIRFHHISNGGQAATNRGLNLLLFHVGVAVFR